MNPEKLTAIEIGRSVTFLMQTGKIICDLSEELHEKGRDDVSAEMEIAIQHLEKAWRLLGQPE